MHILATGKLIRRSVTS